jgi:hypothetical protein
MRSLWSSSVCLVTLLLMGTGCTKPGPPPHVKASGSIVGTQGMPLGGLNIRFLPTEDIESFKVGLNGIVYPLAISDKDGTFVLSMSGSEGARPGRYSVMVTGSKEQNEKIPLRYQNPSSPLEVIIPNNDVNDLILKLD